MAATFDANAANTGWTSGMDAPQETPNPFAEGDARSAAAMQGLRGIDLSGGRESAFDVGQGQSTAPLAVPIAPPPQPTMTAGQRIQQMIQAGAAGAGGAAPGSAYGMAQGLAAPRPLAVPIAPPPPPPPPYAAYQPRHYTDPNAGGAPDQGSAGLGGIMGGILGGG